MSATDETLNLTPNDDVSIVEAYEVAVESKQLSLSEESVELMESTRDWLNERVIEQGRRIYGVTTGYGPLAGKYVRPDQRHELQQNLIYHLCTGVGEPMEHRKVRAMMMARTVSLAQGYSGLRPDSLRQLLGMLNEEVYPVVPSLGTVGASGDLTPLAHLTLSLIGEGEVFEEGERVNSKDALQEAGLQPVELEAKEGLAFVNGTAAMTGMAVLNGVEAVYAAETALRLSLLCAECLNVRDEMWDPLLGEARPHRGQVHVHDSLQQWVESSERLTETPAESYRLKEDTNLPGLETGDRPQDVYTTRCLPQIYGAIFDAIWQHNETVQTELNSVTDNPLMSKDGDKVVHGGNFYGQHVSFASDHLANAVLKIGIHLERCIERITNTRRNRSLPPFLQGKLTGLHSGLMGAQVTATSLVGEMRSRSTPASVQSIPTNGDNQDVVSMGTIAARRTGEHLDRLWDLIAIAGITFAQSFDLTKEEFGPEFSESSEELVEQVRAESEFLDDDRPLYDDIADVRRAMRGGLPESPIV